MIKIYGRSDCIDCIACKKSFDKSGLEYDFRDIGESLRELAVFLKIRDLNSIFNDLKGTGKIGIPALVTESHDVILDWENYLLASGGQIAEYAGACGIDGKGC